MKTKLPNLTSRLKIHPRNSSLPDLNYHLKEVTAEEKSRIVVAGQSDEFTIEELCLQVGITPDIFCKWSQEFLDLDGSSDSVFTDKPNKLPEDERFKIVIEGKSGETSIAEICNRENITQNTFLTWSNNFTEYRRKTLQNNIGSKILFRKYELLFQKLSKPELFRYINNYIDFSSENSLVVSNSNSIKLEKGINADNIVCLQRINDIRFINKHFEKVNAKLKTGGLFVGCLETFSARRSRKNINKIPIIRDLYFGFEFLLKRIIPKISCVNKHYFDITKGNDRLLSKAEGLGRLVSSGFKIMDYRSIQGLVYFVVKKEREPLFDMNPSYGPIYKMPRLGQNGNIIKVYKFRTMHPYSEYLQDYVLKANGYAETGKPAQDFRIPVWGKFMRRFWLDELPQLINVIKGDMKLVGIRPVSQRYFQDIPKEMQKLRLSQKPGCIPPYVALNREANVLSVLQAEKEYLEEKIKNPYTTDLKYLFNSIINILFRHKRSA